MAVIYNIILARKPINNLLDFKSNLRNLRAKFVENTGIPTRVEKVYDQNFR